MQNYKKIKLSKQQVKDFQNIIEMLKTIKGTFLIKNIFTGSVTIFVQKSKPNPELSGKGFEIIGPNWSSGIYHK